MEKNINPEEDGITHINIYSKANTSLGRWLSNFSYSPFIVEFEGQHHQCTSVEGFWYFILTGQEYLKQLSGFKAKQEGKKHPKIKEIDKEAIKAAIDEKLKNNSEKMQELAKTTLPLEHYYCYGGKVVDAGYKFLLEHFKLRRQQLKEYYGI